MAHLFIDTAIFGVMAVLFVCLIRFGFRALWDTALTIALLATGFTAAIIFGLNEVAVHL